MGAFELTKTNEWQKLTHLAPKTRSLRELLLEENRFRDFSFKNEYLLLDYSKNNLEKDGLETLFKLLEKMNLRQAIKAMFSGEKINFTENRSVLHTALRSGGNSVQSSLPLNDSKTLKEITTELAKMKKLSEEILAKKISSDEPAITDVVNIGIGGSYLGIKLVIEALGNYQNHLKTHFIANVDGLALEEILTKINPKTTLFVLVSKSFTTKETLTNALTIKKWLQKRTTGNVLEKFVAVTANEEKAMEFGLLKENILRFGDYIGGRYSLFSPVGFSIMLNLGTKNFENLLAGAHEMDEHFLNADFSRNLPILLASLGIWQINFLNNSNHLVLPYCHFLRSLPSYLQQLDMESNGKSITKAGQRVAHATGPFLWGEVGTNGQHSFYQSLHQGTQSFTADFIGVKTMPGTYAHHQKILLANMLAQSEALALGLNEAEFLENSKNLNLTESMIPHRLFAGNKPSNVLILEKLTPQALGYLIALYEHKVFVQGFFWGINSFDQWGVELGKSIANRIEKTLGEKKITERFSPSTTALIKYLNS